MSEEIKVRSSEEILEFKEELIVALKNHKTITDTDKQCAQRLLDKIKLLEWVMGSNNPFDEFRYLVDTQKWKNVMETTKSKQNQSADLLV